MNFVSNESPQFNFSDPMSLFCNMVSVVTSSIVMSSFSKCPSISPFLKKISSSDRLRRMYGMHSVLVISTLCTVGMRTLGTHHLTESLVPLYEVLPPYVYLWLL